MPNDPQVPPRARPDRPSLRHLKAQANDPYEQPAEVVDCTPLGYARIFEDEPSRSDKSRTVAFLRERGAVE